MRNFWLFLGLLLTLSDFSFAQDITPKVQKKEKEIRAALKNWADAVVSRDINALDKLFSDDLIVTDYNGGTRGKKEELEVLKPSTDIKTISVTNEDVRIRDHGKAVVVTAVTKMKFIINEKEVNASLRYTAVFVRREKRWQITTLQTARIAPPRTN